MLREINAGENQHISWYFFPRNVLNSKSRLAFSSFQEPFKKCQDSFGYSSLSWRDDLSIFRAIFIWEVTENADADTFFPDSNRNWAFSFTSTSS